MMFVGAVPKESIDQSFRVLDLRNVKKAYVCCSGSFRYEQALLIERPDIEVHSNDVSLLSTAIGRYVTGEDLGFRFYKDLEWLEEAVVRHGDDRLSRMTGLAMALRMCHMRGKNAYVDSQRSHYRTRVDYYLPYARPKVEKYLQSVKTQSFFAGDFRDHAEKALAEGGTIIAWPPTHRGDYEALFKPMHANTEWASPDYRMFNPEVDLHPWMDGLRERGANYVVCANHVVPGHEPVALFASGRTQSIYLYSNLAKSSSIRRGPTKSEPFKYDPINVEKITRKSECRVVEIPWTSMNFLKDKYQLPGLIHTAGEMSFIVLVDGMVVGGFVYRSFKPGLGTGDDRVGPYKSIYLLSDFSISRRRKVSKLVAMQASGQAPVALFDRRKFQRTKSLFTTAFTKRPVSMKYRGIYDLVNRGPGLLNYMSMVRRNSPQEIYADWWKRYGEKGLNDEDRSSE